MAGEASTKAKVVNPADFEAYKSQFLLDVKIVIVMEEIPKALEGSKRVEIVVISDKYQITAVFANTMSGDFLPPQIIYSGKTTKCLPSIKFPDVGISHLPRIIGHNGRYPKGTGDYYYIITFMHYAILDGNLIPQVYDQQNYLKFITF